MSAYRLTRQAEADLRAIAAYLSQEAGLHAAERVVTNIVETLITLGNQPHAGISSDTYGRGIRRFSCDPYVIYYRSRKQGIEVVHIFHGARDQKKAWRRSRRGASV